MAAQVAVGGVGGERLPRLVDRLVDDLQVVFDDGDGRGIETAASGLQRLLEIGHRGVVLRIGHADGFDAREVRGSRTTRIGADLKVRTTSGADLKVRTTSVRGAG